jgi:thiamine kinase-like enzyme
MIPEAKKTSVIHALKVTFGVSEFEDISELTTGLSSALVFRMIVLGKPWLLKIITRTDAITDPTYQFNCMTSAAEAGICPRIWYKSIADRISITDFVEARPFPIHEARKKLPDLLNRLHALPPFPFRLNFIDFVDGVIRKFQDAKILPDQMTKEVFSRYAKITQTHSRNENDMVSCHNDLKPENILYDGERPWIVDWESAFLNDRYIDLAIIANFVVSGENEERDYLKSYFGEEASEYQRARFFLMNQVLHMSYFTFFMLLVSRVGKSIDMDLIKSDFRVFHDLMWAGKINLANVDAKQEYAWVHFQQLQHNLRSKRFDDALQIVSSYPLS